MIKMVNGYPCATGCDERLAKKGIDPRNPHQDPVKQAALDARSPEGMAKAAEGKRVDPLTGRPVDPVTGLSAEGIPATRSATATGVGRIVDRLV